jgi:hypothetical protein
VGVEEPPCLQDVGTKIFGVGIEKVVPPEGNIKAIQILSRL